MNFYLNVLVLLFLPHSCQGGSITMKMPSYTSLNSELKVTCEFTADSQLARMELHYGNSISAATYEIDNSVFSIYSQSPPTLEIGPGTTIKGGSLTFVFKSVTCSDFTWYMCKGKDLNTPLESSNKTLQVNPHLDSIQTTTQNIVNKVSTFTCAGTVRKEGVYSVKWYRRILSDRGQLTDATDKVTSENQCSRRILSTLTYNVSESDLPNLILWCRIESGQTVDKSANFPILRGRTITMKMLSYTILNSEMKVTCDFAGDVHLNKMVLHRGNFQSVATYNIYKNTFQTDDQSNQTLEIEPGTTMTAGSLTFVFKSVTCSDFTWYMCKGYNGSNILESKNQTLQVFPQIDHIDSAPCRIPNELSTFTCEGTVRKEGPYSVKWYRGSLAVPNQLTTTVDKVISKKQCSRRVKGYLIYNVSESDVPNLILWCQIESGLTVAKSANFSIEEITTIAATISTQLVKGAGADYKGNTFLVVMVSFIASTYYLF